jgi:Uma2 family endonuclease
LSFLVSFRRGVARGCRSTLLTGAQAAAESRSSGEYAMMELESHTVSTAAVLVSVEEYLSTNYDPDMDYVDGVLEERNVGEWEHGDLQSRILRYLCDNAERFRVLTVVEARVQVAQANYRVPDIVCVRKRPRGGIITAPPVLCIEIISPEDRFPRMQKKIADYLSMGVGWVWVIDPYDLDLAYIYEKGQPPRAVTDRVLTAGEIELNLDELPKQPGDFE